MLVTTKPLSSDERYDFMRPVQKTLTSQVVLSNLSTEWNATSMQTYTHDRTIKRPQTESQKPNEIFSAL